MDIKFTGERLILGKSPKRIESDHLERYLFATKYCFNKNVLDIACGSGYGSSILINAGAKSVVGIDNSIEIINYAKNSYSNLRDLDFICADIQHIQLLEYSNYFDLIVCFETIEHVSEYQNVIENLDLMLNAHGTLLISTPDRRLVSPSSTSIKSEPVNRFHKQEFIPDEFKIILEKAGFKLNHNVFGQRILPFTKNCNSLLFSLVILFMNPKYFSSPKVKPLYNQIARYNLFVCTK